MEVAKEGENLVAANQNSRKPFPKGKLSEDFLL
jgi:hypothetical protein